ncbi:MAG TPA: PQQ-binding-like beta-propeller repeat protein, partial [Vicinamibacteria bacterium]|nr:PQQ-binding-like beta-propeller repeat protein [Vicinamibacteria bacterium]
MRAISRSMLPLAAMVGILGWTTVARGQAPKLSPVSEGTRNGQWPTYTGDVRGSRYSPLDQINAANFNDLEVAWRFKTDSLGTRPEYKLEGTPLMVNRVLYTTAGTRRAVIALDPGTGELLWVHGEHEGARAANAPRQLSGRGLAYWTDGTEERILYVTPAYRLLALDARTGVPIPTFGQGGAVDLKRDNDQDIDLVTGEIGLQSAPVVAKDVVLVGAAFREGFTPKTHRNNKGYVRAFDVRTGKRLWIFHTIPKPGEFGYDTWLSGSAEENGNTGVWTQMTVDEDLGLAYLPVESPTNDFYGGHRPGNNLFGETLVCVDLRTGERKWHFQLVHHPLWDHDISSAPILADISVDGRAIKAVAQPSKQGFVYVFDRVTGKPVWPIEERPVEKGTVPGEWYAPTQPIPTKPPAYNRNGVLPEYLIDFTPALKAEALELTKKFKFGPIYTPPVASKADGPIALLTLATASGGTNWPGASYDPETHVVYASACDACLTRLGLVPPPSKDVSDMDYVHGFAGQPFRVSRGPGENAGADAVAPPPERPGAGGGSAFVFNVQGLPIIKPPYGTISAISLDKGTILWQTPHGETPDVV